MSILYDQYLKEHRENVRKGYKWFEEHLPNLLADVQEHDILFEHDRSKESKEEYDAYDAYFYGGNRSFMVCRNFDFAWLHHIHHNPHHWQHWVLHHDDPNKPVTILNMPKIYIIEMICDWWSFSWKTGNLHEIFQWYDDHKDHMMLSTATRVIVEIILEMIREELSKEDAES